MSGIPEEQEYAEKLQRLFQVCIQGDNVAENTETILPSWCRGWLGIISSKIFIMEELLQDSAIDLRIEKIESWILERNCVVRRGMCLSHGNIGNFNYVKLLCKARMFG